MNSSGEFNKTFLTTQVKPQQTKLYKRRWLILCLYILYAAINAFQWFEYSIITNVVMKFYNVSAVAVDWTSIIYMALYMPMVIPVSYLMEIIDLRKTAIIGVVGTALGTTVKLFSLSPDKMWVTYLGQTILSSMQVFILALPPRIAAVWFGPKEVSLACALGVFGTQLGQAIGFILPPMVIKNHDQIELIGRDLGWLVKGLALFTLVVTVAILAYFPARPPLKPFANNGDEKHDFLNSLKKLFHNRSFNFHAVAYGINIAVFVSISTLLNQFMLFYFPKSEEDAGRIGLLMVILGMIGAIAFGYILDKTHKYKEISLAMYISSLVSVIAFMYSLESGSKTFTYISGALGG
jgi:FLVCR family feline leukemia virus subgroup C receptor-related protein